MEGSHQWACVIRQARAVISRYRDVQTRELRDDMVQESAVSAWQWVDQLIEPSKLGAAVCTIAKRQRHRSLMMAKKRGWLRYVEFGTQGVVEPSERPRDEATISIDGRSVSVLWAKRQLKRVLGRLSALDHQLLLGFYEGFCCAELASRYGRSEDCIKTRIHRARRRVRTAFEDLVRSTGELEEPEVEE